MSTLFQPLPTQEPDEPFKSSITGKTIERANIKELEALLQREYPGIDLAAEVERLEDHVDVYELYRLLLLPLENVKQSATYHPEGDALYHSLQVFELAREARPWDQEFLLAALLHDVGKGIDRADHVAAGLAALEGAITDRTMFLIAHHMEAQAYRAGELGARARRRMAASEDFDDLMVLQELDQRGRRTGAVVCTVDEALDFIRSMPE
jgi:predicted HD phosphohydrolase